MREMRLSYDGQAALYMQYAQPYYPLARLSAPLRDESRHHSPALQQDRQNPKSLARYVFQLHSSVTTFLQQRPPRLIHFAEVQPDSAFRQDRRFRYGLNSRYSFDVWKKEILKR